VINARAYEEERKRAEKLAELDRAKTTLFSNVSHEFRTPLILMLSPLKELLTAGGHGISADREVIDLVHRNGLRLLRLVNTLDLIANQNLGATAFSRNSTNLKEFLSWERS
jgi:signal transduction histidine kinase